MNKLKSLGNTDTGLSKVIFFIKSIIVIYSFKKNPFDSWILNNVNPRHDV